MTRVVTMRPWHLRLIEPQAEQAALTLAQKNEQFGEACLAAGPAWALVDAQHVYACAGLVVEDKRSLAWAILGENCGRHFVKIHRAVKKVFEAMNGERIETLVREGHKEGERWASMLGLRPIGDETGPSGIRYKRWAR